MTFPAGFFNIFTLYCKVWLLAFSQAAIKKHDWLQCLRSGVPFSMRTTVVRTYGNQICLEMERSRLRELFVCLLQAISFREVYSSFLSSSVKENKVESQMTTGGRFSNIYCSSEVQEKHRTVWEPFLNDASFIKHTAACTDKNFSAVKWFSLHAHFSCLTCEVLSCVAKNKPSEKMWENDLNGMKTVTFLDVISCITIVRPLTLGSSW